MISFRRLYSLPKMLAGAVLLLLAGTAFAQNADRQAKDDIAYLQELNRKVKQVASKTTPATVALISPLGSTGSGVIVSPDGLILTAAHVVQDIDEVSVVFPDGSRETAQVLGANYTRDAAMAKIVKKGRWPHVPMGDASKLKVGDYVVAMGHSKGYDANRRPPIRFGRILADGKQRFLMSDCTLIGGDSGGPLFNLKGEVIGIHSSIGPNVAINNHVPLSVFREDWNRLFKGDQWGQLGLHSMVDPDFPIVGFQMMETRPPAGVGVKMVISGSPAEKAGLMPGDIVTKINDREVLSPKDFALALERFKPNDTAELIVKRAGQTYKAPITFGRWGDVKILER